MTERPDPRETSAESSDSKPAGSPGDVGVTIRVEGRVQGVGFRAATQQEARAHGVLGWVRNLPDGSVEAQLIGTPEAVTAVVIWCTEGPRWAKVTRTSPTSMPAAEVEAALAARSRGFEIR